MKIILLGAPGCGKGTQAARIVQETKLPHISTGDIFRDNIARKTELGLKVKSVIDGGDLCPDELTIAIVKDRIKEDDCKNGYLLDGFPRNLVQAKALDESDAPDIVIQLFVPFEQLERRLAGRRLCSKCRSSFNTADIGERTDCPKCGGELYIRGDDNVDSVRERLAVYEQQTAPLIDYYGKQGKLVSIDADKTREEVFESVLKVIK
ncbi:MAG: adenylate kinase [Clostridia bacterium]|nr:adenylate kinase [Clostridia bacterium]